MDLSSCGFMSEGKTMWSSGKRPTPGRPRRPVGLDQSSLICAALTTLAQRARSFLKNCSCSAGVMVTTSAPCPARRERMSGERMMRDQFLVEALDDRVGRAARHQHALPGAGLEAGHALLGDGRHVADQRHARGLGNAQHLELAALHVRQRGEHAVHQHLGLAGDGVLHGLHAALVGHVLPARAARALQRHAREVRRAAGGGDGEVQVGLLRQRDQFLEVVGRHRRDAPPAGAANRPAWSRRAGPSTGRTAAWCRPRG